MKYRKLDANGDYTLGTGQDFWVDAAEGVAQAVNTRLQLHQGDWFLAPSDGVPWESDILTHSRAKDAAIRQTISQTPHVTSLESYRSNIIDRKLTIDATIQTDYGIATL